MSHLVGALSLPTVADPVDLLRRTMGGFAVPYYQVPYSEKVGTLAVYVFHGLSRHSIRR